MCNFFAFDAAREYVCQLCFVHGIELATFLTLDGMYVLMYLCRITTLGPEVKGWISMRYITKILPYILHYVGILYHSMAVNYCST